MQDAGSSSRAARLVCLSGGHEAHPCRISASRSRRRSRRIAKERRQQERQAEAEGRARVAVPVGARKEPRAPHGGMQSKAIGASKISSAAAAAAAAAGAAATGQTQLEGDRRLRAFGMPLEEGGETWHLRRGSRKEASSREAKRRDQGEWTKENARKPTTAGRWGPSMCPGVSGCFR